MTAPKTTKIPMRAIIAFNPSDFFPCYFSAFSTGASKIRSLFAAHCTNAERSGIQHSGKCLIP
jgi:hypothetical protein